MQRLGKPPYPARRGSSSRTSWSIGLVAKDKGLDCVICRILLFMGTPAYFLSKLSWGATHVATLVLRQEVAITAANTADKSAEFCAS